MPAKEKVRRIPPSRVRYEGSHPVVSARLNTDEYERLKQILGSEGKSFAQFLREAIGVIETKHTEAYEQGYGEGMQEWQIWYPCFICGKRIDIQPNTAAHKAVIASMREEMWGHSSCNEAERVRKQRSTS